MKGSAVAQSFKALASKINNQVPLGPRESSRLLTALTSSFRKHLDEVHPSHSHVDGKRPTVSAEHNQPDRHALHSAAVLADKHMASVLTNSLLVQNPKPKKEVKPEFDEATAVAELKSGANPWDLLDSYHAKGCATIAVALACMQHFRSSIKELNYDDQVAKIKEQEAGTRVLHWLWNSDLLRSQAYVDNVQMQDGVVWLAMMEGHEEFLWEWLDSDMEFPRPKWLEGTRKHTSGGHIWKSRILYAMVMTKLGPPHREARSADAALNLYFRAVERIHRKNASVKDKMVLTSKARLALDHALTHGYTYHYHKTDSFLYNRFVHIYSNHELSRSFSASKQAFDEFHRAQLDLWHPTRPNARMMHDLLLAANSEGSPVNVIRDHLKYPKGNADTTHFIKTLTRAVHLLKRAGRHKESDAVLGETMTFYPKSVDEINRSLRAVHARDKEIKNSGDEGKKPELSREQQQRLHNRDFLEINRNLRTMSSKDKKPEASGDDNQKHEPEQRQQQSLHQRDWLSQYLPSPT